LAKFRGDGSRPAWAETEVIPSHEFVGTVVQPDVRGRHLWPHCWPAATRLIASGRLPMEKICTHQLPLADFKTGLVLTGRGTESVKVTLIP
jgi:erythritol/L-threitol dehydrogenase